MCFHFMRGSAQVRCPVDILSVPSQANSTRHFLDDSHPINALLTSVAFSFPHNISGCFAGLEGRCGANSLLKETIMKFCFWRACTFLFLTVTTTNAWAQSPEIAISGNGNNITLGSAAPARANHTDLGVAPVGAGGNARTFTITNSGNADILLPGTPRVLIGGANAGDFGVTLQPSSPVAAAGATSFQITFQASALGLRSASVLIETNDLDENPFEFAIQGHGVSLITDTDSDGMSDWGEQQLEALGFDWEEDQTGLVSTYFAAASSNGLYNQTQYDAHRVTGRSDVVNAPNTYGLYSLSQIHVLNIDAPLLTKDPVTGLFKLTIGLEKSTNLNTFSHFPMSAPGTVTLNTQGSLDFEFSSPDNAAFYRVQAGPSNFRWASSVLAFSSQFTVDAWSAAQALGEPDTYPAYGDSSTAWATADPDAPNEFIELGFESPIPISYVSIYETYAPGAVSKVTVRNPTTGLWVEVWSGVATPAPATARIFSVTFPRTSFPVDAVRIDLDSHLVPDWNEIDAVSIGQ